MSISSARFLGQPTAAGSIGRSKANRIRDGKGSKDRYTILSQKAPLRLQDYLKQYRPELWLFEGQTGGPYSKRSVQNAFKQALIVSRVSTYATFVCVALGHSSSKTTEVYTHIRKDAKTSITSPLDTMDF